MNTTSRLRVQRYEITHNLPDTQPRNCQLSAPNFDLHQKVARAAGLPAKGQGQGRQEQGMVSHARVLYSAYTNFLPNTPDTLDTHFVWLNLH